MPDGRGRGVAAGRPFEALGGATGLWMALAAFVATAAQAQMADVTLVSNIGQINHGNHGRTEPVAQRFNTGAEPTGYLLKSVVVEFPSTETGDVTAKVCTVTGADQPTSTCTDFTGPSTPHGGNRTFTAPGDGMLLSSNTKYALVLTPVANVLTYYRTTINDGEDSGGLSGWNIAGEYRLYNGTSWVGDDESHALKIRLRGSIRMISVGPNPDATGAPDIAGPAQVGGTLRARMGDIADPDGLPSGTFPDGYVFQWIRVVAGDDVDIPGATSATYRPVAEDLGLTLKVRALFLDGDDMGEALTSAETNPVVPDAAPCPALSVWCTVLTSGDNSPGFSAGRGSLGAIGSLDDDTFSFGGTTYAVKDVVAGGTHAIYLATTPDLPADGGGLTLHVQRFTGALDLALADGSLLHQDGVGGNAWEFFFVTETGPGNPSLLRISTRLNEAYTNATDPGTRITVWLSRQDGVSYEQPAYIAYEGGAGAEVTVTLTPAPTSNTSIPITATNQGGATSADWSGVPSILTFTAGQSSRTFTVTARSDGVAEDGESVELGFGILPAGVPEGYLTTATVHLFDPAGMGDARLTNSAGVPTASGEGRLEVFYRGEWGTVCDDRFDSPFTIFGRTPRTVDNHAPTLACDLMGYGAGETIDNGAYRLGDGDPTPIWLDDVRCEKDGRHHTGLVPTQLDHCFHAGIGLHNCDHGEDVALRCTEPNLQVAEPPLKATLRLDSNSHDGSAFTFRIAFTVAVTISPAALRDEALTVTGATLTSASPVDSRGDLWEIEARPTGTSDVTILVPIRACSEAGALCTAAGLPLTQGAFAMVQYAPPPDDEEDEEDPAAVPLTAAFESVPAEHGGAGGPAFRVELLFSEDVKVSNNRMRTRFLQVSEGTLEDAGRIDRRKDLWEFTVRPSSHRAVTLSVASGETCGEVICTFDGRPLSAPASAEIPGPPGLSVADAEVEEGPDAKLAFAITLDRAASGTVTVEASTSDGTATAGEDYRAKTLAKTFAPGETRKVAVVRVLDDGEAEGAETMTLALSDAVGADITDGEATGTIVDGSVQNAVADGAAVYLVWPTPRDGFGTPSGTDYAVRVDGAARRVASATVSGRTARLALASPVAPGEAVTVAYIGSAMHPLADASGRRSAPWEGLSADNVTGTGRGAPAYVEVAPRPADPRSAAEGALRLDASGLGLADLSGLSLPASLERLDLSGNALSDVSALAGLSGLRELDLSDNRIADPWPLAGLHALERLDLSGNRVGDVGPLAGLTNLAVLVLDGTAVADVGPLAHLARLENLGLAGTRVSDVTALQDLPALRRLDLGATAVMDVSPLGDVGSLVWLSLPGDAVIASEAMGRLTGLRWVWSAAHAGAGARAMVEPDAVR